MRKVLIAVLMLAIVTPALAVEGSDVAYTGGTDRKSTRLNSSH